MKNIFIMSLFAFFVASSVSEGADWLHFVDSMQGDRCYIDVDSIERTAPDTMRVIRKVEPEHSQDIDSLVSSLEMDCKGSRIKSIEETTYFKNGTTQTSRGNNQFRKINPDDLDEALLELVCSLKKM